MWNETLALKLFNSCRNNCGYRKLCIRVEPQQVLYLHMNDLVELKPLFKQIPTMTGSVIIIITSAFSLQGGLPYLSTTREFSASQNLPV